MLHYARQFADFNEGDHLDLIQLARATSLYGCLMCAQTCYFLFKIMPRQNVALFYLV